MSVVSKYVLQYSLDVSLTQFKSSDPGKKSQKTRAIVKITGKKTQAGTNCNSDLVAQEIFARLVHAQNLEEVLGQKKLDRIFFNKLFL